MENYTKRAEYLLPFGYLFLIVLGIIRESIFYNQLGINIFGHTTLTDILLSPIAEITRSRTSFFALLLMIGFVYLFYVVLMPKYKDKKWFREYFMFSKKKSVNLSEEAVKSEFFKTIVFSLALCLTGFYMGLGYVDGYRMNQKIHHEKLEFNYELSCLDNQKPMKIHLIASNAQNYFYVEEGSKRVKITPLTAVKSLEILENPRN